MIPAVREYIVVVGHRDFNSFELNRADYDAMSAKGFRFEVVSHDPPIYELQAPFALSGNIAAGTWTFRQFDV